MCYVPIILLFSPPRCPSTKSRFCVHAHEKCSIDPHDPCSLSISQSAYVLLDYTNTPHMPSFMSIMTPSSRVVSVAPHAFMDHMLVDKSIFIYPYRETLCKRTNTSFARYTRLTCTSIDKYLHDTKSTSRHARDSVAPAITFMNQ